jgi:hypothetical protein
LKEVEMNPFFEIHQKLLKQGFHLVGSRLNSGVIFNFYEGADSGLVLLLDRTTLEVREIIDTGRGYSARGAKI